MSSEALLPCFNKERKFILTVWICFIAIATVSLFNHELWRDEWQAWLIVKSSPDLTSLLQKIRYEGHPVLWYLLLWLVQKISVDPGSMQILHLAIAVTSALAWIRFAPFNKLQRTLFIFGYFPLFEFTVISRNYGLGMLLLFLFLTCYTYRRNNYLLMAVLLALLMQTNLFAMIIAVALAFGISLKTFLQRKNSPIKFNQWMPAILILASGILVCYFTVRPPADQHFGHWRESFSWGDVRNTFPAVGKGMIPIPKLQFHFWNTNIINNFKMQLVLALVTLIVCLFILFRKRWVLITFIIGSLMLLTFFYLKNFTFFRHTGSIYIFFISCLWLMQAESGFKTSLANRIRSLLVCFIFMAHVFAAIIAVTTDLHQPFTAAKATTEYIRKNHLDSLRIVGDPDFIMISISGYLDKPVYQLRTGKTATFVVWDKSRIKSATEQQLIEKAEQYSLQQKKEVLLIFSYKIQNSYPSVKFLEQFTESIQQDEVYYLYHLQSN